MPLRLRLTLASTTGSIAPAGKLTLKAGCGIIVLDSLTTATSSQALVMDADYESEGDGTLSLISTKMLSSSKSDVTITAWDIDLDGSLTAGTSTLSVHGSKVGQTIALGATTKDLTIESEELQRITATNGLRVGGYSGGTITVNGLTQLASEQVEPLVSLIAADDNDQLVFATNPSTFDALAAQADNGIHVQADITTDVDFMMFDGDIDDATAEDGHDKVAISGARTLSAIGQLTLDSTSGGIVRSGTATMTLTAQAGILVNDDFTSQDSGQILVINADSNDSGAGTFTMATSQALTTNNSILRVTAADIDIQGTITTGTAVMYLHGTNQRTIGIGTAIKDMRLDGSEFQRITSTGLLVGQSQMNKDIAITGVTATQSNKVTSLISLVAAIDDSSVSFLTTASIFYGLGAQADNGIIVKVDVTASTGGVYLDSDHENSSTSDNINVVGFTDGTVLTAQEVMTLESSTSSVSRGGTLTLQCWVRGCATRSHEWRSHSTATGGACRLRVCW